MLVASPRHVLLSVAGTLSCTVETPLTAGYYTHLLEVDVADEDQDANSPMAMGKVSIVQHPPPCYAAKNVAHVCFHALEGPD